MGLAFSPTGSRLQDLGDRLVVRVGPRRAVVFLTFWLVFWTGAGQTVFRWTEAGELGERTFALFWLVGWALGECAVAAWIVWQLFGRQVLTVTSGELIVEWRLGAFARTTRYQSALVGGLRADRVPSGDGEGRRRDFRLEFWYDGETIGVGEGMEESEAEYVAEFVRSKIGLDGRWPEPTSEPPRSRLEIFLPSALFPLILLCVLGWIALDRFWGS